MFTVQDGRFSVIAKGVHKARSSQGAALQPFQPLLISWSGRSGLKTLNKLEVPSQSFKFTGPNLYCAFYLNELLLNLMPEFDENYEVFVSYASTLEGLSNTKQAAPVLRRFELFLLEELGLLPQLSCDWKGASIEPEAVYYLSFDRQFVRADKLADVNALLFPGSVLLSLHDQKVAYQRTIASDHVSDCGSEYVLPGSEKDLKGARNLMRALVDSALGGKVLKSRELIKQAIPMKRG